MLLLFSILLPISCGMNTTMDHAEHQHALGDKLRVQTLLYNRTRDNETVRMKDDYNYEDGRLISRLESNLDSDNTRTFTYTYDDDLITGIQVLNGNGELESEINIDYNENNQVYADEYTDNLNSNSATYSLATISYENNQILLCDGKNWSSVEYKDVYDRVLLYSTTDDGNIEQIKEIEDCYFAAPSMNGGIELSLEYDDNPSPFINITGNNQILNTIISPFTSSMTTGFSNNVIIQTEYSAPSQEWVYLYNNAGYPQTIQWQFENSREDIEVVYY